MTTPFCGPAPLSRSRFLSTCPSDYSPNHFPRAKLRVVLVADSRRQNEVTRTRIKKKASLCGVPLSLSQDGAAPTQLLHSCQATCQPVVRHEQGRPVVDIRTAHKVERGQELTLKYTCYTDADDDVTRNVSAQVRMSGAPLWCVGAVGSK